MTGAINIPTPSIDLFIFEKRYLFNPSRAPRKPAVMVVGNTATAHKYKAIFDSALISSDILYQSPTINSAKTTTKIAPMNDVRITINRPPKDGHMAFIRSPDGISIEIIQDGDALEIKEPWKSMANIGTW